MLIPRVGFGWVIADNAVAEPGTSECVLSLTGDVDALVGRARAAGATIVAEPGQQPWGHYAGTFADPDGHLWLVLSEDLWSGVAPGPRAGTGIRTAGGRCP